MANNLCVGSKVRVPDAQVKFPIEESYMMYVSIHENSKVLDCVVETYLVLKQTFNTALPSLQTQAYNEKRMIIIEYILQMSQSWWIY